MVYGAEVTVCFEVNKNTLTQCGQSIQFLNVKPVGASRNESALKG